MPQDKTTVGYLIEAKLVLTPVNKYGDKLDAPGSLTYTASASVKGAAGLAKLLNGLDAVFTDGPMPIV